MKVSIIIPIYNVALYVEKCLRSVQFQTYSDIEIILVNDCSTDNSMDIVNNIVNDNFNKEVIIINHSYNQGLSAARNTGIKASKGDYLYFLDSDDSITLDCIEKLMEPVINNDLHISIDFVMCEYMIKGAKRYFPKLQLEPGVYSDDYILESYASGKWFMTGTNKLIKADFFRNNNLYFKVGLLHEDILWSFKLACAAKVMYVLNDPLYEYYLHEGSISQSMGKRNFDSFVIIINDIISISRQYGLQNNRNVYCYIEGVKDIMLSNLLMNSSGINIYDYYKKVSRSFSCEEMSLSWILKGSLSQIIKDLQYLMPIKFGYIYILSFHKIKSMLKLIKKTIKI